MIAVCATDTHRTPAHDSWDAAALLDGSARVASGRPHASPRALHLAVAGGDDRAWIEERLEEEGCCRSEREALEKTND